MAKLMGMRCRRMDIRLGRNFWVTLDMGGSSFPIEGITTNLSRGGAFINFESWSSLSSDTPVVLTFYLPPDFTGQNDTIRLRGDAVVRRIDEESRGIAVEFIKSLREFIPIDAPAFRRGPNR